MNEKLFRIMSALSLAGVLLIGAFIALGGLEAVMPLANTTITNLNSITDDLRPGDYMIVDDTSNSAGTRRILAVRVFSHTMPITVGNTIMTGTVDMYGNISSSTNAISLTDQVDVRPGADVRAFNIVANSTQTTDTLSVRTAEQVDIFTVGGATGGVHVVGNNAEVVQLTITADDNQSANTFVIEDSTGADMIVGNHLGLLSAQWVRGSRGITASRTISVGSWITVGVSAAPQLLITGVGAITPTGTFHQLTSAADVDNTMSVTDLSGDSYLKGAITVLQNAGSNNISLMDTGTTVLSQTVRLTPNGTLMLLFDGTNWVGIAATAP